MICIRFIIMEILRTRFIGNSMDTVRITGMIIMYLLKLDQNTSKRYQIMSDSIALRVKLGTGYRQLKDNEIK